jgi:hypothetical protein
VDKTSKSTRDIVERFLEKTTDYETKKITTIVERFRENYGL